MQPDALAQKVGTLQEHINVTQVSKGTTKRLIGLNHGVIVQKLPTEWTTYNIYILKND